MPPRWVLLVLLCRVTAALSSPATYDQRQTGDLNVQVHLKDVQVLALLDRELLDDYTEYDYIYDYADFTIKPIKPTTSSTTEAISSASSSEITEKADVTETIDSSTETSIPDAVSSESPVKNFTVENTEDLSVVDAENTNDTLLSSLTVKPEESNDEYNTTRARINDKTRKVFEDSSDRSTGGLSRGNLTKKVARKRCRTGYSPDGKGRCRRLNQRRLIPLAIRFGPKLLDDLARSIKEVHLHSNVP